MNNSYNFFALGNYRFKILNLVFASVFFVLDILVHLFDIDQFFTSRLNIHVYLHFMVLVSLVAAVASRQKIDDEMVQKIRYSVNKVTINFMVSIAAIVLYFMSIFGVTTIPLIGVFYYMEFILVFNIVFALYGIKRNPAWLFREPTSPASYNRLMLTLYTAIIVCLIAIFIISQFVE